MMMLRTAFMAFLFVFSLFCAASGSHAAEDGATILSPAQASAATEKAQAYLLALGNARARFLQTAPDGAESTGTFYLSRPGRLRFEYDPPTRDFVVADGFLIYFYDGQLGEQTNAPIGQTLADFLLRKDLRLSGDVQVTQVRRGGDLLQIALIQTADPQAGSLMLGFSEKPFSLKKWRVTDSQGLITEVELFNLETGIALAPGLFVYRDPNADIRRFNR